MMTGIRIGLARGAVELKTFFRERDTVLFTFALPVVLLLLLGTVFTSEYDGTGVTASQYFAASMIAAGVTSTAFVNTAASVASDRADGTLKRLRGLPAPLSSYFYGKVALVLAIGIGEIALMLGTGILVFDLAVPEESGRWFTAAWVFLLGTTACTLLGLAISTAARTARGVGAAANLLYLVLAFISGVFITPVSAVPSGLRSLASLFPLKWMAQGFRAAFLPDEMAAHEPAGDWELAKVALVLAFWCLVGLALALAAFRRQARREA